MVVDLHAITVPHDPVELRTATRAMAATYMAAGVDPARSRIFVQSHVTAHAELQWLLNCATPIGWLNRMIQFKEKARKQVCLFGCLFLNAVHSQAPHTSVTCDLAPQHRASACECVCERGECVHIRQARPAVRSVDS
jgi:tryptophanyl-tRNA synthetase